MYIAIKSDRQEVEWDDLEDDDLEDEEELDESDIAEDDDLLEPHRHSLRSRDFLRRAEQARSCLSHHGHAERSEASPPLKETFRSRWSDSEEAT